MFETMKEPTDAKDNQNHKVKTKSQNVISVGKKNKLNLPVKITESNKSIKSTAVRKIGSSTSSSLGHSISTEKFIKPLRSTAKSIGEIDYELDRWPFCLVWTPLPFVTWFIPLIGHTGIATSQGVIYDFSDDFVVSIDNFSFGRPTKYFQFDPKEVKHDWDKAIVSTAEHYSKTRHSLCFNNCHQHIAGALNLMHYGNYTEWSQLDVWWMITFKSEYISWCGMIKQWWPFLMNLTILIIVLIVLF